jgi:hypothetical protein
VRVQGGGHGVSDEVRVGITLTGIIYARAIRLAQSQNQVVGEKSDYFVTLAQLEEILQALKSHDGNRKTVLDARRICWPGDEPLA